MSDQQGGDLPGASVRARHESGTEFSAITDGSGDYRMDYLPDGVYRVEIRLPGFRTYVSAALNVTGTSQTTQDVQLAIGSVSESVSVTAEAPILETSAARIARGGRPAVAPEAISIEANAEALASGLASGVASEASTHDLGDLFEYRLKERVTIRKNESALVPIVSSDLGVEKVSLWRERNNQPRPLRALWVTNASGLTLDGGSFMVIEGEAFAGEGIMEPMKPGERRLVSYASDLGVLVAKQAGNTPRKLTRVHIERGIITQYSEERQRLTYTARNEDTTAREIIVEHAVNSAWQLVSGPAPEETTPAARRFRLRVAPKSSATLAIEEVHPLELRTAVSTTMTEGMVALILNGQALSPAAQQSLQAIRAQQADLAKVEAAIQARDDERERIDKDQDRVRENLKALQSATSDKSLVERYARQLAAQEDRLEAMRRESDDLTNQVLNKRAEIDRLMEALALDVNVASATASAPGPAPVVSPVK